ncbi:hypothetical protein HY479_04095 [Candidatus Uhrbacteria bacterium]|nr:hypothetical protein [Candidatus Uhrbacteria bacterium]
MTNAVRTKAKATTDVATKVVTIAAALLLFGLAAYGYGFGFSFSPSKQSSVAPAAKLPSVVTKKEPKNELIVNQLPLESYTLPAPGVWKAPKELLKFNITYKKDPSRFGKVTLKQLYIPIILSTPGYLVREVRIVQDGQEVALPYRVTALRAVEPQKLHDITKGSDDDIAAFGAEERFNVFLTFDDELEVPTYGATYSIIGIVASPIETAKKAKLRTLNALTSGGSSVGKYGGYLIHNRFVQEAWDGAPPFLASPNIYHLLRLNSPVDTDPTNPKPNYLEAGHALFSDNSSPMHSSAAGSEGGSDDWFQVVGIGYGEELKAP